MVFTGTVNEGHTDLGNGRLGTDDSGFLGVWGRRGHKTHKPGGTPGRVTVRVTVRAGTEHVRQPGQSGEAVGTAGVLWAQC